MHRMQKQCSNKQYDASECIATIELTLDLQCCNAQNSLLVWGQFPSTAQEVSVL